MSDHNNKVINASKWSAFAEIIGKLVAPVSTMVLARVLTPEAFGVVTTLAMIISFAEIFTDAGFQRYIIQHEFKDDDDKDNCTNVAFWTNLIMSLFIWGIIAIFAESLASLVGNPGLGNVLIVACVSIPLAAFSSIQMAVFKRSLDFKSLFYRRLIALVIPLLITVPLAIWFRSYWALVFGTIATNMANAIFLTLQSPWKPRLYYNIERLRGMLSFSSWSVLDAVLVWCTNYIEIFFIGRMLSAYYLGIYKTSMTTVGQFTSIVVAAVVPVILPAISRLQNDYEAMREMLLKMQKYLSLVLIPLGFGIFMFSGLITDIMLGDQWTEAVPYIGIWGLMEAITIVFSRFCSSIYPAIGKPRLSVIVQILHLAVLVPAVYYSIRYSFCVLFYTRSFIRIQLILVNLFFAYICIKLSPIKLIWNIIPEILASSIMVIFAHVLLSINENNTLQFVWIFICTIIYFSVLMAFREERNLIQALGLKYVKALARKIK